VSIEFQKVWSDLNSRLRVIPGNDFISALSTKLQQYKGFSITTNMIIDARRVGKQDLKDIVHQLNNFCSQ
jgi:hypothetical protein